MCSLNELTREFTIKNTIVRSDTHPCTYHCPPMQWKLARDVIEQLPCETEPTWMPCSIGCCPWRFGKGSVAKQVILWKQSKSVDEISKDLPQHIHLSSASTSGIFHTHGWQMVCTKIPLKLDPRLSWLCHTHYKEILLIHCHCESCALLSSIDVL